MKRRSIILLILFLLGGAIYAGWIANQATEAKEGATKAVNEYLDAVKAGNVEEAMRLSRDTRFADEKARKQGYEQMFTDSGLQSATIASLERIDNTQMTVVLTVHGKNTGDQEVTVPVILNEETDQWILLLDRIAIKQAGQPSQTGQ